MPRGMYSRTKKLPVKKTMSNFPKRSAAKRSRRTFGGIQQTINEDGEFLQAGTTYARDKLSSLSKKEQDYNILLDQAEELADFILKNIPFRDGIPEYVIEAYKAIKHRRLKPL